MAIVNLNGKTFSFYEKSSSIIPTMNYIKLNHPELVGIIKKLNKALDYPVTNGKNIPIVDLHSHMFYNNSILGWSTKTDGSRARLIKRYIDESLRSGLPYGNHNFIRNPGDHISFITGEIIINHKFVYAYDCPVGYLEEIYKNISKSNKEWKEIQEPVENSKETKKEDKIPTDSGDEIIKINPHYDAQGNKAIENFKELYTYMKSALDKIYKALTSGGSLGDVSISVNDFSAFYSQIYTEFNAMNNHEIIGKGQVSITPYMLNALKTISSQPNTQEKIDREIVDLLGIEIK